MTVDIKEGQPMKIIAGYESIECATGIAVRYPKEILRDILDLGDFEGDIQLSPLYYCGTDGDNKLYQYFIVTPSGLPRSEKEFFGISLTPKDVKKLLPLKIILDD